MAYLISEDLLLLLLHDESGALVGTAHPQPALGGGVLIELALAGSVEVEEKTSMWRSAKVRAVPGAVPEDPLLRAAYDEVADHPRPAQTLVGGLGRGLQERLADRLVERGVLERKESKVLGLFPRTRWPAADSTHEEDVRRALTAALVGGSEPDERTGALVALLSAIDKAHKVVDHDGLSAGQVRKRARAIAEGAWAAKAVRDAITASTAAITAVAAGGAVAAGST